MEVSLLWVEAVMERCVPHGLPTLLPSFPWSLRPLSMPHPLPTGCHNALLENLLDLMMSKASGSSDNPQPTLKQPGRKGSSHSRGVALSWFRDRETLPRAFEEEEEKQSP